MSAPRTITIRTRDFGDVTIPEPSWCVGRHPHGGYRVDITHRGPDVELTVPTREGPAAVLTTSLESGPYVADSFMRGPLVAVQIGGDWYETGLAGLEAMADALEAHAEQLRERARELAVVLAGGEGQ